MGRGNTGTSRQHCQGRCWRIGMADPVSDQVVWTAQSFRPSERRLAETAISRYLTETEGDCRRNSIPILVRCIEVPTDEPCRCIGAGVGR